MAYRAYGLTLNSTATVPALREFYPVTYGSDVVQIDIGISCRWAALALCTPARVIPTSRAPNRDGDPRFTFKVHEDGLFFQLVYSDGTRFLIDADATRIWGEAGPGLSDDDLFVYLLGPVLGFVLRKRGDVAFHASAVELGGFAVALAGSASSGKSTAAAALALRGIPVLSEDVTPIKEWGSAFIVEPGYPRICLWPDSVKELLGSAEALPLLTPNWDKHYLALDGVRATFESEPRPLGAIYLMSSRTNESGTPRVEEIAPREALLELVKNTYMNYLLDRDQRAAEFDLLAKLVARVPVRRITPHADPARLPALCDLIIKDAMSLRTAEPDRRTNTQSSP